VQAFPADPAAPATDTRPNLFRFKIVSIPWGFVQDTKGWESFWSQDWSLLNKQLSVWCWFSWSLWSECNFSLLSTKCCCCCWWWWCCTFSRSCCCCCCCTCWWCCCRKLWRLFEDFSYEILESIMNVM
jgi:hypothetical protein